MTQRILRSSRRHRLCHGTHLYHDQSILRNGLDVAFGVQGGISARNTIHFCVATNVRLLKHYGLYCYLDFRVAIGELGLKVMCSKTAQVALVEDSVLPQALCLTRKSPQELGSMCLLQQDDLILPQGRDADQVRLKSVGKIFKASPLLRPHRTSMQAATPSTGSGLSGAASSEPKTTLGQCHPKGVLH